MMHSLWELSMIGAVVSQLGAFVLVAFVVIATPGPDTAVTIRNALRGGRRDGVLTSAGVATGHAIWALAASAGLAAVLSASQPTFVALRIAGAVYLVSLGLHSLRRAASRAEPRRRQGTRPAAAGPSAYRQGLLCDLGNPKMAVFFISLLPQFAGHGSGSFAAMLALGLVVATMTFGWLSGYAAVVARVGKALQHTRGRRALDAATGAALIGVGIGVAAE